MGRTGRAIIGAVVTLVILAVVVVGGIWAFRTAGNNNVLPNQQAQATTAASTTGQGASTGASTAAQSSPQKVDITVHTDGGVAKPQGYPPAQGAGTSPAPYAGGGNAPAPAASTNTGQAAGGYTTTTAAVPGNPGPGINIVGGALNDGRSFDSRTTPVNVQLGYPPYKDTGIAKSANYDFILPAGYSATIGGVTVRYGGKEYDKVALIALQGPVEVHTWIFEGFYQVLPNDQAQGDFCARAKWHKDTNKMWSFIQPLPSWGTTPCPGVF